MRRRVPQSMLLLDPTYYESLDRIRFDASAYHDPVKSLLSSQWTSTRRGVWLGWRPAGCEARPQGWKIHVSTVRDQARRTLEAVVPVCAARGASFKHLLDPGFFSLMNGKNAPREQAGKFITVYPTSHGRFLELLEALAEATRGFEGPRILTDRRYRGSQVVQYRYGGISPVTRLDVTGRSAGFLVSPDGEFVKDERLPRFAPPAWVSDPVPTDGAAEDGSDDLTLNKGKFSVLGALSFKGTGGVYRGVDNATGREVIIKEARPFFCTPIPGVDSTAALKREYDALVALQPYGITPEPIDLFQDWEHWFLVEEAVSGVPLQHWLATNAICLKQRVTPEVRQDFWRRYRKVYGRIAEALDVIHTAGFVYGDVSTRNIFIDEDAGRVRLIDVEGVFRIGTADSNMFTFGFAPANANGFERPSVARDCWGLGAMMMGAIAPVMEMLPANPGALDGLLADAVVEVGVPGDIAYVVRSLMAADADRRMTAGDARAWIAGDRGAPAASVAPTRRTPGLDELVEGCGRFILDAATFDRRDRLFPAHAEIFETNPLSVAYGACGVAYVLQTVHGACPQPVIDWILSHPLDPATMGPGLYSGLAGVAWTLAELGLAEQAAVALGHAVHHPRLADSGSLFHGTAGVGLAALACHRKTGDPAFLEYSRWCAEGLLARAETRPGGLCWRAHDQQVYYGLGHGSSGPALLFLYLSQATGDTSWLEAGRRALAFDLSSAARNDDFAYAWSYAENRPGPQLPYLEFGAVGVAGVVLRYARACPEDDYGKTVRLIASQTLYKYSAVPGYLMGMAGLGQFFVDLAVLGGEESALDQAHRLAHGLSLVAFEKPNGYAFMSEQFGRISCDLGTGTAGVLLFLHNLLHRQTSPFLLDELLPTRAAARADAVLEVAGGAA